MSEAEPCRNEAFIWRECLKRDDYNPDRQLNRCDRKRELYYSCMTAWRSTQPEVAHSSGFDSRCAIFNDRLHACMKLNLFQVALCKQEMRELQDCTAKFDSSVRQALQYELKLEPEQKPSLLSRLFKL